MTEISPWDISLAYDMVKQHHIALTDRQIADSIVIVAKNGGDVSALRAQIQTICVEKQNIESRYDYLGRVTSALAENLKHLHASYAAFALAQLDDAKLIVFNGKLQT